MQQKILAICDAAPSIGIMTVISKRMNYASQNQNGKRDKEDKDYTLVENISRSKHEKQCHSFETCHAWEYTYGKRCEM